MSITTVIDQNNTTLAYLQDEDYSNAIMSSLSALTQLHATAHLLATAHGEQLRRSEAPDGSLDQLMLLYHDSGEADCAEDNALDSRPTYIYDHGILIPSSIVDPTITTPIIIFNSALVHHLSAEAKGGARPSPRELNKAKRLYELAYGSQTIAQNLMFRCVIFNNIAMIDQQLGNAHQLEQFLGHVVSVLMLFVDQGCRVQLRHLQGFWANVCSISPTATAA
ncbi:MAG: hypothetical protein SGBAC_011934 [Bacillariaceae sp.]